jgi:hypothetical protein
MNIKSVIVITIVSVSLMSCTTASQRQLRDLGNVKPLNIVKSDSAQYDYIVQLRNVWDIGYNADEIESRNKVALSALSKKCPEASVVGEDMIVTGESAGKKAITYYIQVKCTNG